MGDFLRKSLTSLLLIGTLKSSISIVSAQEATNEKILLQIVTPEKQELVAEKNDIYESKSNSKNNDAEFTYTITPEEVVILNKKSSAYSGKEQFDVFVEKTIKYTDNYNRFVIRKGVKPLEKLTNKLTSDTNSIEKNIENILDFVSNIDYADYTPMYPDSLGGYPDSLISVGYVLTHRQKNCAAGTVLFASLCEQFNEYKPKNKQIDLYMVYLKGHLTIAVNGNFPTTNELYFEFHGKKYFYAETTTTNFKIGETGQEKPYNYGTWQIQKPGDNSRIYDMKLHKNLKVYNTKKKSMNWHHNYGRKEK